MNRRSFLHTTSVFTAGTVLIPYTKAGSSNPQTLNPRTFTMSLRPGSVGVQTKLPDLVPMAAEYGFEAICPDTGELAGFSQTELERVLGLMDEHGLVWGAAGLPVDFRGDDVAFLNGLQALREQAAALQRAGVTRIGTWIRPGHEELTYRTNFNLHAMRLAHVADVLARHEIRLGLEYVAPRRSWTASRYAFIHTLAETLELIDAMRRDNVGLVLDSWHWYTAEESKEDLLTLSNQDIVACDLNDAPANLSLAEQHDLNRELPGATGVIDLEAFLGALAEIGYDGPIRAEPFSRGLNLMPDELAVAVTAEAMKEAFSLVED